MMDHLIQTERRPETSFCNIGISPEVPRARLNPIHHKMDDKVTDRQPPKTRLNHENNRQGQHRMNSAMKSEWSEETPIGSLLLKHIAVLQRKIGDEVFQLKHDEQNEYRIDQSDRRRIQKCLPQKSHHVVFKMIF
jgi:hypothetical protein